MGRPDTMKIRALSEGAETMVVDVAALGEEKTVEIGLDSFSAPGFRQALALRPFKERYGSDYTYWLRGLRSSVDAKDRAETEWWCVVRVKLGRRNQDVAVSCSRDVYYKLRPLFPSRPPNKPLERTGCAGRSAPIR